MKTRINYIVLLLILSAFFLPHQLQALTIDQAIQIGKERSLRQEAPRIEKSRVKGQITEAWSNALPQVDALASYQRNFKSPVMFFPGDSTGNLVKIETQPNNGGYGEVVVNQPIYTFGRIDAALKAAYATRRSNDHLTTQTERTLEYEIAHGFWSVLLLDEVVKVRREGLEVTEGALNRVTRLRDVGMLTNFDVLRARSQVSNLVPDLLQAENDRNLAQLALLEVLGLPLDTTISLEGTLDEYTLSPGVDTTIQNALERDDLMAMRDGVEAYRHILTLYKNAGLPTIGAQLKYSWQWGDEKFKINDRNSADAFSGGIALNIPIWNSGKVSGKAQQVQADLRKMKLDLANAERGVQLQLAGDLNTYRTAQLKIESALVAVNEAIEARKIAEIQLENGQSTPLDLQTAQLNETSARLGLANARYALLVAAAELRLATGQNPYPLN